MPDTKISALASLPGGSAASGDLLPILDVNDTSMAGTGTDKSISLAQLGAYISQPFVKGWAVDGGGQAITSGSLGTFRVPNNCYLTGWEVIAIDGVSGSVTVTLNNGSLTSWLTTGLTSIIGTGLAPYLSNQTNNFGNNFAGYTTGYNVNNPFAAGSYLEAILSGLSGGITKMRVELILRPTGS